MNETASPKSPAVKPAAFAEDLLFANTLVAIEKILQLGDVQIDLTRAKLMIVPEIAIACALAKLRKMETARMRKT